MDRNALSCLIVRFVCLCSNNYLIRPTSVLEIVEIPVKTGSSTFCFLPPAMFVHITDNKGSTNKIHRQSQAHRELDFIQILRKARVHLVRVSVNNWNHSQLILCDRHARSSFESFNNTSRN